MCFASNLIRAFVFHSKGFVQKYGPVLNERLQRETIGINPGSFLRDCVCVSSFQVYLSLLRMYLSTPDAHCLGPIKLQLSEPQTNLQAALRVLELHHSKLNTTKVNGRQRPTPTHIKVLPEEVPAFDVG